MISFSTKGELNNVIKKIEVRRKNANTITLEKYAKLGLAELILATPVDSGKTALSWRYEIIKEKNKYTISFCNDNVNNNVPIAIILQYGHSTKNGAWIEGTDYINPAIEKTFKTLSKSLWKEISK